MISTDRDTGEIAEVLSWLRGRLLRWFAKHGRKYAWRNTDSPYQILIAEMMLRRTRADQVAPVYEKFIKRYPNLRALSYASLDQIKREMRPLGLPTRAEEVWAIGREAGQLFNYTLPADRDELKQLSGVGDYVAGAVLSTGFGKREWIIDTNVVRVFRRFFGLRADGDIRRSSIMQTLTATYVRTRVPKKANLALLDHAALICKPSSPVCSRCPISKRCSFLRDKEERRT